MNFEMYQDNIMDHYESPSHRGTLEHPTFEIRDLNPLCGDEVRIQARIDDESRLVAVRFEGKGCVISLAAASMLMEEVEGKTLDEVKKMGRQGMLDLLGVPLTMMRVKCAMLALRALEKAIHRYEEQGMVPPQFT
jgi:nitrogen fixation NifU-like protein